MISVIRKPVAVGNFKKGRMGHKVVGIVIHITAADDRKPGVAGTDAWFNNPASGVSAHYLVSRDPKVHQYVNEEDRAQHAGIVDKPTWYFAKRFPQLINASTIGIEHEGLATQDITEEMYKVSAELILAIAKRWTLFVNAGTVVPHHAIRSAKPCPGIIDIAKLISMANALEITT